MKKTGKFVLGFLSVIISGCSNSFTVSPNIEKNISNDEDYTFSDKALSTSYLSRKFNNFLNPVQEHQILKELQYGAFKEPELVKDVINMNPGMLDLITPLNAVSTFRENSPSFSSFMDYLEQPQNYITTIAGDGYTEPDYREYLDRTKGRFNGDNLSATETSFNQPGQIAFDHSENIFVADYHNNRVRKIDKVTGIVTTVAGKDDQDFSDEDGLATRARLNHPAGLAFDKAGNLYFNEEFGCIVRKVSAVNGEITSQSNIETIAGTGSCSPFNGNNIPANEASFGDPWGLALDSYGNVYVADGANQVILKIAAVNGVVDGSSLITKFAGTGQAGFNGDGKVGTETILNAPFEVYIDKVNNMYISDDKNYRLLKLTAVNGNISPQSIVTTIAGNHLQGDGPDGAQATKSSVNDLGAVTIDNSGHIIMVDYLNHKIKSIDDQGNIHTIAGDGYIDPDFPFYGARFSGDNGPAIQASLFQPDGIIVDKLGNIFVADSCNNRIRKINK
jgi:hypothetical protein